MSCRYPVDFAIARERLLADLADNYDFALHLGQAPGNSAIHLEAVALNAARTPGMASDLTAKLIPDGPAAFESPLPLHEWAAELRGTGIPAHVSFHGGTYLCNALMYWTSFYAEQMALKTQPLFVHLPLETTQAAAHPTELPSLPAALTARAVHMLLRVMEDLR